MARAQLRVYYGPECEATAVAESRPTGSEMVTVTLAEIMPLLADAVRSERTWLSDFASDPISVTSDLYEVILAYQHFRRPSA